MVSQISTQEALPPGMGKKEVRKRVSKEW